MSELKNKWCDLKDLKKLIKKHGESSKSNFSITDTIPIPHSYMITSKHLEYNDSMYLGKKEIELMEKEHGSLCGQRDCNLKYEDHKSGLLILCKIPMSQKNNKNRLNKELHVYLMEIKKTLDLKKFEGFVFIDKSGNGAKWLIYNGKKDLKQN